MQYTCRIVLYNVQRQNVEVPDMFYINNSKYVIGPTIILIGRFLNG